MNRLETNSFDDDSAMGKQIFQQEIDEMSNSNSSSLNLPHFEEAPGESTAIEPNTA